MGRARKENLKPKPGVHDDFDATITKSRFGIIEGSAEPSLIMTLEGEDTEISYVAFDTGTGWQIVDGGRSVTREKRRNFVVHTAMAYLEERVLQELDVHTYV